jgi:two-component sensor histidine kinase
VTVKSNPLNRHEVLAAITNRSLLQPIPIIFITILTTLVHIISSVDLGFRDLHIRTPLAIIAILPLFLFIWLAHKFSTEGESRKFSLVIGSYLLGGAVRGAILEESLLYFDVIEVGSFNYRVIAGMAIVTSTTFFVSYTWTNALQAQEVISILHNETTILAQALNDLRKNSLESDRAETKILEERISADLVQALQVGSTDTDLRLNKLIYETIRPLSQDFAQDVKSWQPPKFDQLQYSFSNFWNSIDPIKHLKTPLIGIIAMVGSSIASLLAFLDLRDAIEVIVGVTIALLLSTFLLFRLSSRIFERLKPPLRDLVITLVLLLSAVPAVIAQRLTLSETEDPNVYVIATFFAVPVFGWIILTGSAALALSKTITIKLLTIKSDLKWVIARINLLSWYKKGVISRLLHGPIQNSVQVALLRLKSADENKSGEIISEVIQRIDLALKEILDPKLGVKIERQTLNEITETWKGVADISLRISESCQEALRFDLPAASIVTDLLQEICSNAIRHGQAQKIQISANSVGGAIDIDVVSDNKKSFTTDGQGGLGTQFLNSCSIEWSRKIHGEIFELNLKVPTSYESHLLLSGKNS